MSDIDAVIELLERWRDASGMGRLRIGMDATRVIGSLPAQRKRALAIEVAERVAPQLVPAIRSESGDLSPEQVGALVDLLRRADRDQLDELVEALRTGDVVGAVSLVDDAVDAVAPPTPETDALLADIAAPDEDGDPPPAPGPAAAAVAAATAAVAAVDDEDDADDAEVEITEDGQIEIDEAAIRRRVEAEAAERAARFRDTSRDAPRAPAYRAPDLDFGTDLEMPDPTVEELAPLEKRLDDLPGAPVETDELPAPRPVRPASALRSGPVTAVLAAVTATPDGFRRRRAAMAALREHRLDATDVLAIVRSLARSTDRSWVAGAAIDDGVIGPADLEDLDLSAAAVDRLRRRAG